MRKVFFVVLVLISIFSAVLVIAKDQGREEVPNGMEILEVGKVKVLVPQGTKVKQEGNVVTVEDISAYSARRFLEMEGRFAEAEGNLKTIKERICHIEEHLAKITIGEEELKKQVEGLKMCLDKMQKEQ